MAWSAWYNNNNEQFHLFNFARSPTVPPFFTLLCYATSFKYFYVFIMWSSSLDDDMMKMTFDRVGLFLVILDKDHLQLLMKNTLHEPKVTCFCSCL